jgi:hypothetical protein
VQWKAIDGEEILRVNQHATSEQSLLLLFLLCTLYCTILYVKGIAGRNERKICLKNWEKDLKPFFKKLNFNLEKIKNDPTKK